MKRRVCTMCGVSFEEAPRVGRPRSLCDDCRTYDRRRGWIEGVCDCGKPFRHPPRAGRTPKHCSTKCNRRMNALARYGLTISDFLRMRDEQGGLCAICERPRPLQVDHDHETGRVRALLCTTCNTGLGKFYESEDLLTRAAAYAREQRALSRPSPRSSN